MSKDKAMVYAFGQWVCAHTKKHARITARTTTLKLTSEHTRRRQHRTLSGAGRLFGMNVIA